MVDLQALLNRLGLNQRELAATVGKSEQAITNVKKGKMPFPVEWKDVIREKFNVEVDDFEVIEQSDKTVDEVRQIPNGDFMEVSYLPISAQAGYLDALESQVEVELQTMLIPTEFEKGNYLIVEISGDSMNDGTARAIQDGDRLLVKELQRHHWANKLHFNQYLFVIASSQGIVCKQILDHNTETGILTCHSWNPAYKDYLIDMRIIYKIFYVKKIVERRIRF